ncbi:MAG TPA: pilus assembly protein PilM [Pirellulales bacterium]|jgi:type IV pilus assembly protein PilM|nr:pilus assembly protein PilM [Pirellulales bacterium]
MAQIPAVWGIDIGESALKALRCVPNEEAGRITATAFDYIEYPKILSQPDADRNDLVREALKQFLSRNAVRFDKLVISVSGQSGLARFIKLPPVEASKIPDIVKYEAKQQIPFPLEDVVWDYQQMSGGSTEEGFALDSEVGLFAMKRDQVFKYLKPFDDVDVEVDTIQLTPLALYNYVVFDQLTKLPPPDEYDPDNPPESVVVLSLGTDTTDLVVTNGFKVWQRSIPVGGNHFTKAMVKELKMNFGTAEHLKRNAAQAEDPKALFQAMRPVFSELLTEVQRSLGYFKNMDRKAKVARVVALGNAMKLPGLQKYLAQNLSLDVTKVDTLRGLSGSGVIDQPAFKENLPAFGVCYGLALQGLGVSKVRTNLLPPEIIRFRQVRAKKPWAVLAAASLLLGLGVSYASWYGAVKSVWLDDGNQSFKPPLAQARGVISQASQWQSEFDEAKARFAKADEVGQSILQNFQHRDMWLKFLRAVNLCLPRNEGERPKDVVKRDEIKIDGFLCRWEPKLEDWYATTKTFREADQAELAASNAAPVDPNAMQNPQIDPNTGLPIPPPVAPGAAGPTGPGWVFQVDAHHYHNIRTDPQNQGVQWLRRTLLANLEQDEIGVPPSLRKEGESAIFPVKKLGIGNPVFVGSPNIEWENKVAVPDEDVDPSAPGAANAVKLETLPRYDFKLQFCWQPFPPAPPAPNPMMDEMAAQ